ncbi:type II CAAX endopeptidase family protein [Dolosigranulum savutiense]|uniref:Type II CAAX endopeptidase family protein n=1 Tax=Dolosigranulum savutiense TaxID=3110288 RepID=A0AB74TND9_9LACT
MNIINKVILSMSLILIAGLSINISSVIFYVIVDDIMSVYSLLFVLIAVIIGFICIPYLVLMKLEKFYLPNFNVNRAIILCAIILLVGIKLTNVRQTVYPLIISIGEEFLFRFIIYTLLLKEMTKFQSIIVCSLLFGVVLHLNSNFLNNILWKFPAGIIFSLLYEKYGLQDSIALHWIYNLTVSILN